MPVARCAWQCGRRCADADVGQCAMSKAAAAKVNFSGIVVTCDTCERSGCLDCVEKLSKKLSGWLASDVASKLAIACSNKEEEDMWEDIINLTWRRDATGRTWRWSEDGRSLIFSMCPLDVQIREPARRAPAVQVRSQPARMQPVLQSIPSRTHASHAGEAWASS